jgi:hypothetical protein
LDRRLLKLPFSLDNTPGWICPACEKGILEIKKDSFHSGETVLSRAAQAHIAWEPDWIDYVYTCVLICSNGKCKEFIVNSGTGGVSWDYVQDENGELSQEYQDIYLPKYFVPHLNLFHIPNDCPESVKKPLKESFKIFFSSPNASANNIRAAIEELLTDLKIKRFSTSKGKRRPLSLHQRIDLLPDKYSTIKNTMFAIKWLGNAGSHGHSEVTKDDVMDAFELTEHILEEIYEPKTKKIEALAKKINKHKGPAK